MKTYKCHNCGGELEFSEGDHIGKCIYCGSVQALPEYDEDVVQGLLDKAAAIRQKDLDFDRATAIYDLVLSQNTECAEAYWGLVLCKYGILYEKNKKTGRWIPTINRAQTAPVSRNKNYLLTLQYAQDTAQYDWYVDQARTIDITLEKIQQKIITSEKYDVFISYKEKNDYTQERTKDSVLAQNIYNAVTKEGLKAFFSRISLESAIGSEYEPIIYSALQSAKVMLVVGTSAANINSPWVRNEWSRFRMLVNESKGEKVIIPCYADMNPGELPEELNSLQAQDLTKIGAEQDLIRGIRKIIPKEEIREAASGNMSGGATADSLLLRAERFLKQSDWSNTNDYCQRALDIDPNDYRGYWFSILADYKKTGVEDFLANYSEYSYLEHNRNYNYAYSLAPAKVKEEISRCARHVVENNRKRIPLLETNIDSIKESIQQLTKNINNNESDQNEVESLRKKKEAELRKIQETLGFQNETVRTLETKRNEANNSLASSLKVDKSGNAIGIVITSIILLIQMADGVSFGWLIVPAVILIYNIYTIFEKYNNIKKDKDRVAETGSLYDEEHEVYEKVLKQVNAVEKDISDLCSRMNILKSEHNQLDNRCSLQNTEINRLQTELKTIRNSIHEIQDIHASKN